MELTRFLLERIQTINPGINAYITVCDELAMQAAKQAEMELSTRAKRKSRRDRGPLHGIPISLKDNIYTKDVRTTGGSQILKDFVPLHDAPVVRSLKKAGAVILGKTNMHEFAYGVTTENPHFGTTRNPWDRERIAGGSSGGSAAALAAGLCYGSIGTDTGGSIRIPASLCGVVGLKPGLGRVSAEDVIPLSPTLDFVGPLARSVEDATLLLEPIFVRGRKKKRRRAGKEFFAWTAALAGDSEGVFSGGTRSGSERGFSSGDRGSEEARRAGQGSVVARVARDGRCRKSNRVGRSDNVSPAGGMVSRAPRGI